MKAIAGLKFGLTVFLDFFVGICVTQLSFTFGDFLNFHAVCL